MSKRSTDIKEMLGDFEVFDFRKGSPYVTLSDRSITFNRSVMAKLDNPEYVCFLIKEGEKKIAIMAASERDENAVRYYAHKEPAAKSSYVRWSNVALMKKLKEMTGWDLSKATYRVNGHFYPEEKAVLFDLSLAVPLM